MFGTKCVAAEEKQRLRKFLSETFRLPHEFNNKIMAMFQQIENNLKRLQKLQRNFTKKKKVLQIIAFFNSKILQKKLLTSKLNKQII